MYVRNAAIDGTAIKEATIVRAVKVDIIMNQKVKEKRVVLMVVLVICAVRGSPQSYYMPSIAPTVGVINGMMANHNPR